MCDKCESEWVLRWEAHLMPLIPYSICWCICISTVANDDGHQICFYFASKSSTRRKRKFDNKEEREHHKKKINGSSVAREQTQKNVLEIGQCEAMKPLCIKRT